MMTSASGLSLAAITCSTIAVTDAVARTVIVLFNVFGMTTGCTAIWGTRTIWLRSCDTSCTSACER